PKGAVARSRPSRVGATPAGVGTTGAIAGRGPSLYRRTQTPTLWPQGRQVKSGAGGATAAISRGPARGGATTGPVEPGSVGTGTAAQRPREVATGSSSPGPSSPPSPIGSPSDHPGTPGQDLRPLSAGGTADRPGNHHRIRIPSGQTDLPRNGAAQVCP